MDVPVRSKEQRSEPDEQHDSASKVVNRGLKLCDLAVNNTSSFQEQTHLRIDEVRGFDHEVGLGVCSYDDRDIEVNFQPPHNFSIEDIIEKWYGLKPERQFAKSHAESPLVHLVDYVAQCLRMEPTDVMDE